MATEHFCKAYSDVLSYSRLFNLMQPDSEVVTGTLDIIQPEAIVELGCGSGRLLPLYLRTDIQQIIGIDVEPGMVAAFGSSSDPRVCTKVGDIREPISNLPREALVIVASSLLKHLVPADRRRTWQALARSVAEHQAIFVDHCALIYGVDQTTRWTSYADSLRTWWPDDFLPSLTQFEWRKEIHGEGEILYYRRVGEPASRIEGYRYDLDVFVSDAAAEGFVYYAIADRYPGKKHILGERRIGFMVRPGGCFWEEAACRIRSQVFGY